MRQFNEDTLTAAVVERFQKAKDPRFRQIIGSAVKHLHAFAREGEPTGEKYEPSTRSARFWLTP